MDNNTRNESTGPDSAGRSREHCADRPASGNADKTSGLDDAPPVWLVIEDHTVSVQVRRENVQRQARQWIGGLADSLFRARRPAQALRYRKIARRIGRMNASNLEGITKAALEAGLIIREGRQR